MQPKRSENLQNILCRFVEQILVGHQNRHWCEKFNFSCKPQPRQNMEMKQETDSENVWFANENNDNKDGQAKNNVNGDLPAHHLNIEDFVWFDNFQKRGNFEKFKNNFEKFNFKDRKQVNEN